MYVVGDDKLKKCCTLAQRMEPWARLNYMQSKRLLIQLIEYLELFEQTVPGATDMDLGAFLAFADSLHQQQSQPLPQAEVSIARQLSLLHRFSRSYIKKALAASDYLQSEEEYTYLVCLMRGDALTKTELHQRNGLEKTSGAEVIRRLSKHRLIQEEPAPNDKRSILVRITPQGHAELMRVFPQLRLAADILASPLDERQRRSLLHLLEHLTHIHSELNATLRDASLQEYHSALAPPREV